jgi:hypothetical protein
MRRAPKEKGRVQYFGARWLQNNRGILYGILGTAPLQGVMAAVEFAVAGVSGSLDARFLRYSGKNASNLRRGAVIGLLRAMP